MGSRLLTLLATLFAFGLLAIVGFEAAASLGPVLLRPGAAPDQDHVLRVMGDLSRVLGVALSVVVSLCALAIPLTANVYTPKLIEIFVSDRLNRAVIGYYVVANVFVLWNHFIVFETAHPETVRLRVFASLVLTLVGLAAIGPYIVYVLRFLVPRSIVRQLEREVVEDFAWAVAARHEDEEVVEARAEALENIKYLGNIALRSVDRYDRDTAFEALRALRAVFDAYHARKEHLPAEWFRLREAEILGLGPELGREVEKKRAALEVSILLELSLVLPLAMSRLPEVVAFIAALTRRFGVRCSEKNDAATRELVTLFFNTFLRGALQHKSSDAFYKFVYQYRRFAEEALDQDPDHAVRVAFFLDYYGHQAARMGMGYLLNVVAYDLAALTDLAWRKDSSRKDDLLTALVALDRDQAGLMEMPGVVKAQAILAAKLHTRGHVDAARRIKDELKKVSRPKLEEDFGQIVAAHEENFWEIADRRRHLDHVEPEFRPAVEAIRAELLGRRRDGPGERTQRFLAVAKLPDSPAAGEPLPPHRPRRPTVRQDPIDADLRELRRDEARRDDWPERRPPSPPARAPEAPLPTPTLDPGPAAPSAPEPVPPGAGPMPSPSEPPPLVQDVPPVPDSRRDA